jgi:hypothetical protein
VESCLGTAEQGHQLFMHNLDNLLTRSEAAQDFLAYSPFLNPVDKIFNDFEIDVRFEEREPHLAKRLFDVIFFKNTSAAEFLKNRL